jgi:hypothetical protein
METETKTKVSSVKIWPNLNPVYIFGCKQGAFMSFLCKLFSIPSSYTLTVPAPDAHRNKYMEEKFHREKKTIKLIETLVECIEFWSKLCANGKIFYCGISLPYIYFYADAQ